jgi:hypothetical protein
MDTLEVYRALRDVPTFAGVFLCHLLPAPPLPELVRYTLIVNTDVHTDPGSYWVAVHLDTRSSSGYYFDSYGLFPLVPAMQHFIRRNCTPSNYTLARCRLSLPTFADSTRVYSHSAWAVDMAIANFSTYF